MTIALSKRDTSNAASRERSIARAAAQDAVLIGTRRTVHERVHSMGLSLCNISRELGRAPGWLTTWLYRGSPKNLPEDVLQPLARALKVTATSLRDQPTMGALDALIADLTPVDLDARSPVPLRDVPLRPADRPLGWEGADCTHALRPAHLAQRPPSFAFVADERHHRVPADSVIYVDMVPRPKAGDLVAVYRDGSIISVAPLAIARDTFAGATFWKVVAASFP